MVWSMAVTDPKMAPSRFDAVQKAVYNNEKSEVLRCGKTVRSDDEMGGEGWGKHRSILGPHIQGPAPTCFRFRRPVHDTDSS